MTMSRGGLQEQLMPFLALRGTKRCVPVRAKVLETHFSGCKEAHWQLGFVTGQQATGLVSDSN